MKEDNYVGKDLRQIRKEKGLTQIEVAERAGISVNSLRLYEAGKRNPRIDHFKRIMEALGGELIVDSGIQRSLDRDKRRIAKSIKIAQSLGVDPVELEKVLQEELNCAIDELPGDTSLSMYDVKQPLSDGAHKLLNAFDQLNDEGQQKAVERVEELTEIPKYKK